MPRNGSGQYNPLTNTWNPPVTGVLATGADFQAQLNDISAAITQSVSKDGQTPMTANLPMGNNSIVGIASGTEISPSISANGDTNTGLYFPAADTVAIATGGVKRVEVDASGNVGVGVTPSAWGSGIKSQQIGNYTALTNSQSGFTWLSNNAFFDTAWKYLTTNRALYYAQDTADGEHKWYNAASGTAGNAITFTQAMTLDVNGNLIVGDTSSSSGLSLVRSGSTSAELKLSQTGTSGRDYRIASTGSGYGSAGNLIFYDATAAAERARITSDGNLLVGYTTSNGGVYKLQVNSQIFATSSTIATSDGRYKENITPLDGALNLVKELNPVQFSWKEHPVHAFDTDIPTVGFIAQELQQVLSDRPYLNSIVKCNECTITAAEYETIEIEPAEEEIKDEDGNVLVSAKPAITEQRLVKPAVTEKFLGIAEGNLIAILTKAIQEQQVIIEAQKTAIESLTARITALEAK